MKPLSRCECGAAWPRPSRICHCEVCHETFTGEKAFVAHRRGRHGIDRRCAPPSELLALGLRKNDKGRWHCPAGVKRGHIGEPTYEPRPAA